MIKATSSAGLTKALWVMTAAALAVSGAGVWAITARAAKAKAATALPKELSTESLRAQANQPGAMMDTMRATMQREDLTEDQKREAARNMRELFRETMLKNVNEYFAAADDEEKNNVLDRHIDQFQGFMKEMEKRREEFEKNRKPGEEENWRRVMGPRTQQERKAMSESRNPDEMARAMAYFGAMQKRMSERGIKMPQWGWGRGAGPGGRGRGPGGRGP
jgi:hypothetical protein